MSASGVHQNGICLDNELKFFQKIRKIRDLKDNVYINYFGGRSETELTTAQLTLITDEGSVNEKQETFIVPMRNAGELTLVKSFDW